jgi:ribosomal protein L13
MSKGHTSHLRRQTWVATNASQVPKLWRHVDAEGVPLGRLAADIASSSWASTARSTPRTSTRATSSS